MIKGIIALFTTGIMFNPLAWLGIGSGVYLMLYHQISQVVAMAQDWRYNAGLLLIIAVYTLIFKRSYYSGATRVNWSATVKSIFGNYFYTLFVAAITCLCFIGFDMGSDGSIQQSISGNKNVRILQNEATRPY